MVLCVEIERVSFHDGFPAILNQRLQNIQVRARPKVFRPIINAIQFSLELRTT
jgi:hypothetical protein